jgi:hypothetical protein
MNDDDREILDETLETAQENNKILKKLQRAMRVGRFIKFLYWGFIIAITLGAYYYIQPVVDKFTGGFGGIESGLSNLQQLNEVIPNLLEQFKKTGN